MLLVPSANDAAPATPLDRWAFANLWNSSLTVTSGYGGGGVGAIGSSPSLPFPYLPLPPQRLPPLLPPSTLPSPFAAAASGSALPPPCEVLPLPPLPPITLGSGGGPAPPSRGALDGALAQGAGCPSASFGSLCRSAAAAALLPPAALPPPPPPPPPPSALLPPPSASTTRDSEDDTAVCDLYGEWMFERIAGGAGKAAAAAVAAVAAVAAAAVLAPPLASPLATTTLELLIGGFLPAPVPLDLPQRGGRKEHGGERGRNQWSPPPVDSPELRHTSPAAVEAEAEAGGALASSRGGSAERGARRKRRLLLLQQEDATPVPSTPPKHRQVQNQQRQRCRGSSSEEAAAREGQAETPEEAPLLAATAEASDALVASAASASSADVSAAACRRCPARAARGKLRRSRFAG